MDIQSVLGLLGIVVALSIALVGAWLKRNKDMRQQFKMKKSGTLQPTDLMHDRGKTQYGYSTFYHERPSDFTIREAIASSRNVLVVGDVLDGKTRSLFEALFKASLKREIIIPENDYLGSITRLPPKLFTRDRRVVVLDDIQEYAKKGDHFLRLIRILRESGVCTVATCWSGELNNLRLVMRDLMDTFFPVIVRIPKVNRSDYHAISQHVDIPPDFEGAIGFLFYPYASNEKKWQSCNPSEKQLLKALKRLFSLGLYKGQVLFQREHVLRVFHAENPGLNASEWEKSLSSLRAKEIIKWVHNAIHIEQTWLTTTVDDEIELTENLKFMRSILPQECERILKGNEPRYYTAIRSKITQDLDAARLFFHNEAHRDVKTGFVYWGNESVRDTAMAGLCLSTIEGTQEEMLGGARDWLMTKLSPMSDPPGQAWNDELWDTGMALVFLPHTGLSSKDSRINDVLNWIDGLYDELAGNWQDEIWESSWTILGVVALEARELYQKAKNAARWIVDLQDLEDDKLHKRSRGRVVTPHYTAYALLIADRLLKTGSISEEDRRRFGECTKLGARYLIDKLDKGTANPHSSVSDQPSGVHDEDQSEEYLWTKEGWSNGLILWALTSANKFPVDNAALLTSVVNWFDTIQEEGKWQDREDTAYSVLGLHALGERIDARIGLQEARSV